MITKQLFKRAATLAAQGQFSEMESTAVLRNLLLYDYRPEVFDGLLILAPVTDPLILLRFLKAYRREDIIKGLALMKECGRGDLTSTDLATITMIPERVLPADGVVMVPPKPFPLSSMSVDEFKAIAAGNHKFQKTPEELLEDNRRKIEASEADPVLLSVDTKWSGLVAEIDENNLKALSSQAAAPTATPDWQLDRGGMSPAEYAIYEQERQAVEAFENTQKVQTHAPDSGGVPSHTATEALTPSPTEIESLQKAEQMMVESSALKETAPRPSTDSEVSPPGRINDNDEDSGLAGVAVHSSESHPESTFQVPVCPPLDPTPNEDFDKFFRRRIDAAADEVIMSSKRGILTHDKFFLAGKVFAQMQHISPNSMQRLVDRGLDIVDTILAKKSPKTSDAVASSDMTKSIVEALAPNPVLFTPSYAVGIACGAFDFFALVLVTGAAPTLKAKARRRVSGKTTPEAEASAKYISNKAPVTDADADATDPELKGIVGKSLIRKPLMVGGGVHLIQGLHIGIHDVAAAVIKYRSVATLSDLASALRAYVVLIKTGYGTETTIPMAKILLETIKNHIDLVGGARATVLPRLVSLVPPIRTLSSSSRFPEARLVRVKIASILQPFIFDSDDDTFYKFAPIAIEPESGVYGKIVFSGQEKLRRSRVEAYVDSAFNRVVPCTPRRLAICCELLQSVGRRRFGLARHAVFTASQSVPRTLRDFVDSAKMISFASMHSEFFSKGHGGYDKLVHMNSLVLGVENIKNAFYTDALSRTTEKGPTRESRENQADRRLIESITIHDMVALETGTKTRALFDAAALSDDQQRHANMIVTSYPNIEAEEKPTDPQTEKFALRLMQSVGPYRAAMISSFANEPFILNWFIQNQKSIHFNTMLSSLRILGKSEKHIRERIKLQSAKDALEVHTQQKATDPEAPLQRAAAVPESHLYQQLTTFLLVLLRYRLNKTHRAAYAATKPNGLAEFKVANPKEFVVRNKGLANIFRLVTEELLSVIATFEHLSDSSKIHSKAIMSLAQRTNRAAYGAVILDYGKKFDRAVDFDKTQKKLTALNFNHLLDAESLKKTYTIAQMVRLISLLHEYYMELKDKGGMYGSAANGRRVTIAHWDALIKALRYRVLNDTTSVPDHRNAMALLRCASFLVRDVLEAEESALSAYVAEEAETLRKAGSTEEDIMKHLSHIVLPSSRLDPLHHKAIEALIIMVRWISSTPPSEHHVFSVEHVVHFFKLFCLPAEGKLAADRTLKKAESVTIGSLKTADGATYIGVSPNANYHTITRRVALSRHFPPNSLHCTRIRGTAVPPDVFRNLIDQAAFNIARKKNFDPRMTRYLMDVSVGRCPAGHTLLQKTFKAHCHKSEENWDPVAAKQQKTNERSKRRTPLSAPEVAKESSSTADIDVTSIVDDVSTEGIVE